MIPDARLKRTVRQGLVLPVLGQHPAGYLRRYLRARGLTFDAPWGKIASEIEYEHAKLVEDYIRLS